MEKLLKLNFVALILLLFALPAFGQSSVKIEQELTAGIKDVQKYSDYGSNYDEAKLTAANANFEEKLVNYTKTASTLNYKFAELGKLIYIATSEDGKFRIYSWDTEEGGTMHSFSRVYQFQGADGKVYSKNDTPVEGDSGSFVYDIFALQGKRNNVYIVCSYAIGSTSDNFQSADLFSIDGAALNDKVRLIKTKSGLTNTLGFEYNFFSVVDRKERPIKLISYDKAIKTINIPVVIADKQFPNGKVTNKFISYKFDGNYFVKAS